MSTLSRLAIGTALPLVFLMGAASNALSQDRVALVVGNSDYSTLPSLAATGIEAQAVAKALESADFEVTLLRDVAAGGLSGELATFRESASEARTLLVYFAGHGSQMDGEALLSPVDASEGEGWSLTGLLSDLSGETYETLVFLDASRMAPGLAPPEVPLGTFVAMATQPGAVSVDGAAGGLGAFAAALIDEMSKPGVSISDSMINLTSAVGRQTNGEQIPWSKSALRAQFYFEPAVENRPGLSDADLAAINSLDEDSLELLLAALGQNGVALEIMDVEVEDDGTEVATLDTTPVQPLLTIEDLPVDEEGANAGSEAPAEEDAEGSLEILQVEEQTAVGADTTVVAVAATEDSTVVGAVGKGADGRPDEAALAAVAVPPEGELARAVQEELARVGCYRSRVDGQWGRISRVSLLKYYATTGSVSEEEAKAEPTARAYQLLKLEPEVVCKGAIATASAKSSSSTRRVVVQTEKPAPTRTRSSFTGVSTDSETGSKTGISLGTGAFR